jgi:hypothetical protein
VTDKKTLLTEAQESFQHDAYSKSVKVTRISKIRFLGKLCLTACISLMKNGNPFGKYLYVHFVVLNLFLFAQLRVLQTVVDR